jgi:hypothetical protein
LSLEAEPFAMALAMAASASSGLRANFGTMTACMRAMPRERCLAA